MSLKNLFYLNNREINLIAEIGNNHNGSIEKAFKLVDLAKKAGVACVKFQMRNLDEVYTKKSLNKKDDDLGSEYIIDLLKEIELSTNDHFKIFKYCKSLNLEYICTPWDFKSVDVLEKFNVSAYKVASADLTNLPLIEKLISTKKPLILSTGMSTRQEIICSVNLLNSFKSEFTLLHCNSTYPAPYEDINLRWIDQLKKIHKSVGYSGHERGINVSIAAYALGANVIEKHFTLDRNMDGPDHAASLEYKDLKKLVIALNEVKSSLGKSDKERFFSQGEMINRENLSKSIIAAKNINKNQIITKKMLAVKSPGQGLSPQLFNKLIGKKIKRNLKKEDYFYISDIDGKNVMPITYNFQRPWGIPVRYHDFEKFNSLVDPDFWEFHLSYSDLNLKIDNFFSNTYKHDFIVHAPELFEDSNLLDLASKDMSYRKKSIDYLNKVIEVSLKLKKYFPNSKKVLIVTNIGGYSMDNFLKEKQVLDRYELFASSLEKLNLNNDIEIIPQTMAPFPWHFGGQRFQNLFVKPEETSKICKKYKLRLCFDISHSYLVCNYYKFNFLEFCKIISAHVAHIHLGDAKFNNGEGLQIGDGEINFKKLFPILKKYFKNVPFIPEIWQGHKNNGEGFWKALNKINKKI